MDLRRGEPEAGLLSSLTLCYFEQKKRVLISFQNTKGKLNHPHAPFWQKRTMWKNPSSLKDLFCSKPKSQPGSPGLFWQRWALQMNQTGHQACVRGWTELLQTVLRNPGHRTSCKFLNLPFLPLLCRQHVLKRCVSDFLRIRSTCSSAGSYRWGFSVVKEVVSGSPAPNRTVCLTRPLVATRR